MLNELKKLLLKQNNQEKSHEVNPSQDIAKKYQEILEENERLKERNRSLVELLDTAMDEIILCQQRYEAVLKQLRNKNGGEQR